MKEKQAYCNLFLNATRSKIRYCRVCHKLLNEKIGYFILEIGGKDKSMCKTC